MHDIEKKLFLAVRKNQDISSLLSLMDDCDQASFNARDAQGNTILHHAILHKSRQSFEMLFEHLKNTPDILFQTNHEDLTIFSFALSKSEHGYAQYIFERIEENTSLEKVIASFFLVKEGSPFHLDIQQSNPGFFNFLNAKLKDHPDFIKILNHPDRNKNTALHLAVHTKNINYIAWFLNSGADFYKKNDADEMSIDLIESNNLLFQVFKLLDNTRKEAILKYYRNKLFFHLEDIETKTLYFKLASLHSLQARIKAELEFNPKVPLQTAKNPKKRLPAAILYSEIIPPFYRKAIVEKEEALNIVRLSDKKNGLYYKKQQRLEQNYWLATVQIKKLILASQEIKPELRPVSSTHPKTRRFIAFLSSQEDTAKILIFLSPFVWAFGSMIVLSAVFAPLLTVTIFLIPSFLSLSMTMIGVIPLVVGPILEKFLNYIEKPKVHSKAFEDFKSELLALKNTLMALKENNPSLQKVLDEIDKQIQTLKDVDVLLTDQVETILDEINASLTDIGLVSLAQTGEINYAVHQPETKGRSHYPQKCLQTVIGFFHKKTEQSRDHSLPHDEHSNETIACRK